ncbi:MAG: efflux RND transporter periplasmic adaptor subunit [Gemmataceae bacterium]
MRESTNGITGSGPPTAVAPDRPAGGRVGSFLAWTAGAVPTLLVMGGLVALALWGHHTGWQLPGAGAEGAGEPSLASHWLEVAPEGQGPGWCARHGVHRCPLENPEAAQVSKPPVVTPADRDRADRALAFRDRPGNDPACPLARRSVRFESEDAVAKAGIDVAPAWRSDVTEAAAAPGEVTYDQTRLARLSARAGGAVWRVLKRVGDRVRTGDVLAVVDSAEVSKAKADFAQGHLQVAVRGRTLAALKGVGTQAQLREAEASYREAQLRVEGAKQALANLGLPVPEEDLRDMKAEEVARRLQFLGLPAPLIKSMEQTTATSNLIPVRSPLDGEVIAADVVAGAVVDAGKPLFTVADPGRMWLHLNVGTRDAPLVRVGQKVTFRPDGERDEVAGAVSWVSTAADEKTRTVRVRAELPNPAGRLRSNTLGPGRVVLREEKQAVVVPTEALQSDGDCHFVFVRDRAFLDEGGPKAFHVRTVRPGARSGEYTEVIAGLWPGEVVATKGSAFLRSEVRRNLFGPAHSGHRH